LRLAGIAVVDCIEHQFDPGRDSQLVEDAEQVFLDGVLAKVEFPSRGAIAETLGNESHHWFFPRGKELAAVRVGHTQVGRFRN
jgi:hypothetical protein